MQKKRGISLIVLVITIIVMIILAAAIIISLNNSGIIGRTSDAVKAHNEEEVNNIATLAWSEAYLGGARTVEELRSGVRTGLINSGLNPEDYGMIVTTSGVKITKGWLQDAEIITKGDVILEAGDLIQYDAGVTGYQGAWKVLGAEDGKFLIMSTKDVDTLELYGLEGNNNTINYGLLNGIPRLNEICEAYGHGVGATGARSIKVEDLDKITGFDKRTYEPDVANQLYKYGNKVTYSWNTSINGMVNYVSADGRSGTLDIPHGDGFSYVDFNTMTKTTIPVNGNGMPTLTSNSYYYSSSELTNSEKAIAMLFEQNGQYYRYWLASPYVHLQTETASYGLQVVNGGLAGSIFYNSLDYEQLANKRGVRAVVYLSSDIKIGTTNATAVWSYTI